MCTPHGQTRIETSYRAHDIDAFKIIRPVLLEDRRVLHRVLVGPRRAVYISRIRIPRRRRIRMIIGDLAFANYHVMRKHAAHRFMEAAPDRLVRNLEICPGLRVAAMQISHRFFHKVERSRCRIRLEVSACTIPLNRITPLRNLPLELCLRQTRCLRQINLDAMPGGFDVSDIDNPQPALSPRSARLDRLLYRAPGDRPCVCPATAATSPMSSSP